MQARKQTRVRTRARSDGSVPLHRLKSPPKSNTRVDSSVEGSGRFAPSPTGTLHLGNLRTAVFAEYSAHSRGYQFLIRMEDLDRLTSRPDIADKQLLDLESLGVKSDRAVVFQSGRFDLYRQYVTLLEDSGLTFECFCSRREIQESVSAPHAASTHYPGTCRDLSESDRRQRSASRPAAIRLRTDRTQGENSHIDDIVLIRNDGVPAYNLAVVVDDELQGVTQVVRGEDLAHVTPSQNYLQRLLGFRTPEYVHLPLMFGPDGHRLSKRHGDVTLSDCLRLGFSATAVRSALLHSLELGTNGWDSSSSLAQWLKSLL